MKTDTENRLVEVFSDKIWEAETVKGFLESAGIQAFLHNEIVSSIYPISGNVGLAKVMVLSSDFDRSAEIVEEYKKR